MVIIYKDDFIEALARIREFIALDSVSRADNFTKELRSKIEQIPFMPYRFRKNAILNDKNIRDLIFKGYVVSYKIDEKNQVIKILSIFKYNMPKF
ncbi:type II toxin-antitoxin system RelE/ParE family toxin [Campylobacter mucosalis]|uniref:Putative toxin-antitoxin system, toxin component, RelE/ParE family n=1 Tax=Campylobacter mucosalis CCUG 21559 TaxID=1032067 RepID=A0A6G5QE89_9BACT|nr:type II toxin-antitoxin system RelE/ParE family toxin [Campylobacter mucosalis]KEA45847.1 plasmid stabilization protein [Campylobacter mucosalis]QCD44023.1 putative toxin-antitoxin system, toxin component, RelE/ParE family [Campylobacter mucosalis CCUG 21559]QKF62379.1 toxin-antitoxin system, toxin component, RelE/ParE family [Campylobacter mucosalis]